MGNNCVGPNAGARGFFQSISAALSSFRNTAKTPESLTVPSPSSNGPAKYESVNTPPEHVKIHEDDIEPPNPSSSSSQPRSESAQEAAAEDETKPASDTAEANKPAEIKKPNFVSRMRKRGVGLQINYVLQHSTGRIKDAYSLGRKLGQGQFGTTYLCIEKATGKKFACKSIAKRKLLTPEDVEDVRREIQILHHLRGHPNVVSIVDAYEDAVAVHVVMELCAGGELFDRIVQKGHYTEKAAAELSRVIVGVVEACHSLGVMHRDLKPENFLFVNQMESSPLKMIDFGLSIFFKPGDIFTDLVGSPYYMAPELLLKHYGQESDVWSAGIIIYILLSGVPPFWDETPQGIYDQVLKGELDFSSEPWPGISESAKDLVRKMLVRDVKKRLTAYEVLCHPWAQVDGVAPDKPLDSAVLTRLKQFSATNKLKKIALRVIAERLSEEELAGLKEMFKMIDTDNSGQITFEELKSGLERIGADLKESEILALMKAADIDNNGTIGYGEFIAATMHLSKVVKEDNLFAAFQYFDKDGSGYITLDELQQACEEFGVGDTHLEEIIREIDEDNDGQIDYNEFVAMMHRLGPKEPAE